MHNVKIEDLEFIGENYLKETELETNIKKQKILNSYDEFQIRKLNFLNERYEKYSTKITYWNIYINNLHYYEKNTNQDIMNMESAEIENLINSCTYSLISAKKTAQTFCVKYKNWAVDKGLILVNTFSNIIEIKEESKLLKERLYSKSLILEIVDIASKEDINLNMLKPLVLGRMGIIGKQAIYMRTLKWNDIDVENNQISIHNEDESVYKIVDVDKWAIDLLLDIQNLIDDEFSINRQKYVLESGVETEILNYNTLNNWMRLLASTCGINRISFAELMFSRQIELLLRRRKKARLTNEDVYEIISSLTLEDFSLSKITVLKNRYRDITGDTIFRSVNNKKDSNKTKERREDSISIGDVKGEYQEIMDELGFNLEE